MLRQQRGVLHEEGKILRVGVVYTFIVLTNHVMVTQVGVVCVAVGDAPRGG